MGSAARRRVTLGQMMGEHRRGSVSRRHAFWGGLTTATPRPVLLAHDAVFGWTLQGGD